MYPKIHHLEAMKALEALYSLEHIYVNYRSYVPYSEVIRKINEYRAELPSDLYRDFLKQNVTKKL